MYHYAYSAHVDTEEAYNRHVERHRLAPLLDTRLTAERLQARKRWSFEAKRMPFVMLTPMSYQTDDLKRQRIQSVMTDYTPAKYNSLKLEFSAMADQAGLPPSERRQLRRLIDQAEAEEAILLEELITAFMRESMHDNEDYHASRARLTARWQDIMQIRNNIEPVRAKN